MTVGIVDVTYLVRVDWDMTEWSNSPSFDGPYDDISAEISSVSVSRGKNEEAGNSPAATCDIRLIAGLCWKYSPVNSASPLYGQILPWRPIQVQAVWGGNYYTLYTGFISKISIDPNPSKQSISLYCTDGMDLLARQMVTLDYDKRNTQTEGEAVSAVLDAAGWGSNRSIDSGNTLQYPTVYE